MVGVDPPLGGCILTWGSGQWGEGDVSGPSFLVGGKIVYIYCLV